MNWEAVSAIGGVLGAIVVAGTLVFLVLQVRQSTKATNATITHGNITAFNDLNTMLAANPHLAEILDRGSAEPGLLSADERYSYIWLVRSYMNLYLNLYDMYLLGTCPESLWRRHAMELQSFARSPGLREFLNADSSYDQLIEYIDSLPAAPDYRVELRLRSQDGTAK